MFVLRRIGASMAAMVASLMSSAAATSSHIRAPHAYVQHSRNRSHSHRKGPSGAKHRRKAAERTFGLSPRGH